MEKLRGERETCSHYPMTGWILCNGENMTQLFLRNGHCPCVFTSTTAGKMQQMAELASAEGQQSHQKW